MRPHVRICHLWCVPRRPTAAHRGAPPPGYEFRFRSNFRFADPVHDRFYNPHAVQQLTNGNIVLMDDGAMRPNCTCEVDGCDAAKDRCFSRAIEYELDFVRMEVGGVGGVGGSSARSELEKCRRAGVPRLCSRGRVTV